MAGKESDPDGPPGGGEDGPAPSGPMDAKPPTVKSDRDQPSGLLGGAVGTPDPDATHNDAGPDDDLATPPDGAEPSRRTLARRTLDRWGPYRRWRWYRVMRKHDLGPWKDRDPEDNERGRLPATERIEVPALWIAEVYTPSTVSGLLGGIAKLGWDRSRTRDDGLAKWMNDVREGRLAGWTNLGLVLPPDSRNPMRERTAELPDGVQAALLTLMSITPALTALVCCFIMTTEAAGMLDGPLRADYATYVGRDPQFRRRHLLRHLLWGGRIQLGGTYHSPDFQRRDAAKAALDYVEESCARWMRRNLPGVFAGRLRDGQYPTAMLFVGEEIAPLTDEAMSIRALEGTAMDRGWDAWRSDDWPGARMVLPRSWGREDLRLRFGCRRTDAFPDEPGYPEPGSNWTISQRANDLVQGLLTRWALSCLLDGYHQVLSNHRDRSAGDASYRPVRDLRRVRSLVRTEVYDILVSAAEITSFAEAVHGYEWNVIEMEYVRLGHGDSARLLSMLRDDQKARAGQVRHEAELLLSTLSTSAEVTQTISNIRVQRFTILLTVISIAVAVIALVVALNAGSP